jgi:hypothetical protein
MEVVSIKGFFDEYVYYRIIYGTLPGTNEPRVRWLVDSRYEYPQVYVYIDTVRRVHTSLHCVIYKIQSIKVRRRRTLCE